MARDYKNYSKDALIAHIQKLEKQLKSTKYGIYWDKSIEQEDVVIQCRNHIPVLKRDEALCIMNNPEADTHILIEGDNFHALTTMNMMCGNDGFVDVIYIDPPYNTGNKVGVEGFIYNDIFINKDDGYTHSKWLSFMENRLQLAKKLLKENGVIFISIDDNEMFGLKLLCDSTFGEHNFQANITYVRKTSGKQDSTNFAKSTEYILVYSKSRSWICNRLPAEEKVTKRYNKTDSSGRVYREVDLRKTGTNDRREDRPNLFYPFYYNSSTEELLAQRDLLRPIPEGFIEILPKKADGTDGTWRWELKSAEKKIDFLIAHVMPKYRNENKFTIYEKDYIDKKEETRTVKEHTFWDRKEFNSDNALTDFTKLGFSNKDFPFPKSVRLIEHILKLSTHKDSTVLDFFAGSGTTAQALLELNAKDGGHRKCIICTNNEGNICKGVTYPRVKTVISGKRADGSEYSEGIPANLMYYRTDFIEDSKDTDQAKYCLVEKTDELLCIIEETYIAKERTDQFAHYESLAGDKHTFIYSDYYNKDHFDNFKNLIKSCVGEKIVYMFSTDNTVENRLFEELEGITVKPIPSKIYEIYKEIAEDIKRGER